MTKDINQNDNRPDIAIRAISDYIRDRNNYHNHKENMAYLGVALFLATFGSALVVETWPPYWLYCSGYSATVISSLGFGFLFIIALLYVKWQLLNRRATAMIVGAAEEVRFHWIVTNPKSVDLGVKCFNPNDPPSWCSTFCGYVWPNRQEVIPYISNNKMPKQICDSIDLSNKLGPIWHERIVLWTIWVTFIALMARTLFS